ncbi:MAG: hypothetical protein ABSB33_12030 [Tepidisphaeraceae bacterium]|jgi:hypothetical protein
MTIDKAENPPPLLGRIVAAMAIFIVITFSVRLWAAWKNYHQIDPTAGVWTAAALDARQGMLYRPIVSDIGYGGSRYAPLHVVLQAGLMRIGLGPVASGYLLDAGGVVLVIAGLYALMRQLEVPAARAGAMACFVLAAYCYCTTAGGLKGDLLPAGLNLAGLSAVVRATRRPKVRLGRLMLLAAAICFVLATATKITSVFGIASAGLWLAFRGRWRAALFLGAIWVIGIGVAAWATQRASDGRALEIFRLCAAGGGGMGQLLLGPRRMFQESIHSDRIFVLFWLIALGLVVIGRAWTSLPVILFIITSMGTVLIFGSPGTNANHLVDLDAAAVLVIATQLKASKAGILGALAVSLIVGFAGVNHLVRTAKIVHEARHGQMLAALAQTHGSPVAGPLLSENPILPILEGERPYMLDSFMFRTIRMRQAQIAERFWTELSERHFRAVILNSPPSEKSYETNAGDFGPGFIKRLEQSYTLSGIHGDYYVYLPKSPKSSK